jgi:hypothetical protein
MSTAVRIAEADGSRAFEISVDRCRRLLRLAGADEQRLDPIDEAYVQAAVTAIGGVDALIALDAILRRAEQCGRPNAIRWLHERTVPSTRITVESIDTEGNLQSARRDSVLHELADAELAELLVRTMIEVHGAKSLLAHFGFRAPPAAARNPARPIGFAPWRH